MIRINLKQYLKSAAGSQFHNFVRSATSLFLRRHFEEKIHAEEKENDVR